jgi:hypothetical protein
VIVPPCGEATRFEGSYSSDGSVYDLGSALGYNFSRHFGVDAGVPLYFVGTSSSIKKNNPGAVSGIGVGSFFTDLKLNYPMVNIVNVVRDDSKPLCVRTNRPDGEGAGRSSHRQAAGQSFTRSAEVEGARRDWDW